MKILLVNYRYFISGGPEKYMFNVKKLLEEKGHEVVPFSVHSDRNEATEYDRYFVEPIGSRDAVYFDEVKKTPKSIAQMIGRSVYSLEVKRAIKREIAEVKPDLVYIIHFVNKLSPSVIVGAKEMGVPVVLRLSDFFMMCPRFDFLYDRKICEECLKNGSYMPCIRKRCVKGSLAASVIRAFSMKIHEMLKVYDKVDAFISPSQFLRSKLIEAGYPAEKIHHIPTFTNVVSNANTEKNVSPAGSEIDALRKNGATAEEDGSGYALYFGRITEEKGVATAVEAYSQMPDKRLLITGDDTTDEAARLKKLIEDKGLTNIEFTGFKSGKELDDIMEGARFVIIPSIWYDNLPNTALESFRHSKPIIASNTGSLPELVTDGYNGLLFKPGDAADLAAKAESLYGDDALIRTMGDNGRQRLSEQFAPEKHYGTLMGIFEDLVNITNE